MKALYRLFVLALALSFIVNGMPPVDAQLSDPGLPPNLQPFRLGGNQESRDFRTPKSAEKKTLEDIFRKVDPKGVLDPPPLDLSLSKIPGLSEKSMGQLAMNYFVTVQSSQYKKMSDVYAENRVEGKPNFVTVDSIMHPYYAFTNGMMASAIEESVIKDLQVLLRAMLNSSIADYRRTEDEEVRDDIQRNLAYLCVALRLLEPNTKLPDIGGASQLVDSDLALLEGGKFGRSRIFNVEQDYGTFKAWGFMATRPRLRRFFTAYQWLSRMAFPLSNTSDNSLNGGGNTFRRSVLLYRSIVLANTGKEPALEKWNRIALMMAITGFDSNARKKTIIPPELAPVLRSSEADFNRLLQMLSQPFLRTKLLLSVRNARPVELNARSVFEMDSMSNTAGDDVVFRFFPLVDPPEMVWLREEGHDYVENTEGPNRVPLGLINLHAHGAQQATNLLNGQIDTLDKGLSKRVPRLERLVRVMTAEEAGSDRHWAIVSNLYRQYPDTVQLGLRTETWLNRQLETALAAWVDSYNACLMIPVVEGEPGTTGSAGGAASSINAGSTAQNTNAAAATSQTNASPAHRNATNSNSNDVGAKGLSSAGAKGLTPPLGPKTAANSGGINSSGSNPPGSNPPGSNPSGSNPRASNAIAANVDGAPAPRAGAGGTGKGAASKPGANDLVKVARFHYLEPRIEIYKVLQEDANNIVRQLTELRYMPQRYVQRQQDFLKLLKRLVAISDAEIKNEPISITDFNLLANIDRVLQPVDCPFASYIYLDSLRKPPDESSGKPGKPLNEKADSALLLKERQMPSQQQTGATIGIGRAGKLYIICSTSQGNMLSRGGCYTFYEIKSGPLKDEHWERKLTYGLLQPPYWTRRFNVLQETSDAKEAKKMTIIKE